jgi:diguanylate cyclase (GGDEF)-like protein
VDHGRLTRYLGDPAATRRTTTIALRVFGMAVALPTLLLDHDASFSWPLFGVALALANGNLLWLVYRSARATRGWFSAGLAAVVELLVAIAALGDRGYLLAPLLGGLVAWSGASLSGPGVVAISVTGGLGVALDAQLLWSPDTVTLGYTTALAIPMVAITTWATAVAFRLSRVTAVDRAEDTARVEHSALSDLRRVRDELTGLLNRRGLIDHVALLNQFGTQVAVLLVDVRGVGLANVRGGSIAGDRMLRGVAAHLVSLTDGDAEVCRASGDQFAVLVPAADSLAVRRLADTIAEAELTTAAGRAEFVVGVAIAEPGSVPDSALREAESAVRRARDEGHGVEVASAALRESEEHRATLDDELRTALDTDTFVLHYQPIVRLATGRISHAEALIRWQHPTRGLLSPAEFVEEAERSGLIVRVGEWALFEACREAVRINADRPERSIAISVNVTPAQAEKRDLADTVLLALATTGCRPSWLRLELTETTLVTHADRLTASLARLREEGVAMFLDDFGTGYSSLGYLRSFPCEALKIDRTFITGFGTDGKDSGIVAAILSLARTLGIRTIAEGIEQREQAAHLDVLGCDYGQGYLFSPPVPAAELEAMLDEDLRTAA